MTEQESKPFSERVRTAFEELHGLEVADRDARLLELGEHDERLQAEVASLLRFAGQAVDLESKVANHRDRALGEMIDAARGVDFVGKQVGDFRIEALLGRGGMGEVYRARQLSPARTVALKVMRPLALGLDDRFAAEIGLQGALQHPGIARIFTAGTTDEFGGERPYFAMELVHGRPVDEYCTEHELSVRERVRLIARIANALQYAHEEGVVHRDLKPSNVLVGPEGHPKLIDFGVASSLFSREADDAVSGTPAYMSPEALQGNEQGAALPCADVYSLGVIAFELLLGRLPREKSLESEADLEQRLGKDLAAVLQKMLAPEARASYSSMRQLRADLLRFLDGEPVVARAERAASQRPWWQSLWLSGALGTVAALVGFALALRGRALPACLALGVALVGTFLAVLHAKRSLAALEFERSQTELQRQQAERQRQRAERQREKAERTSQVLVRMLSSVNHGGAAGSGEEARVVDLLRDASESLGSGLEDQAEVEAALRQTLGLSFRGLGLLEEAERELGSAVELRRSVLGERHEETLESLGWQAVLLRERGCKEEALALQRRVAEWRDELLGPDHPQALIAHSQLGLTLKHTGSFEAAERELRHSLEGLLRRWGDAHMETAIARSLLAGLCMERDRFGEAEELFGPALDYHSQVHGDQHPETLKARNNYAQALARQGKHTQALEQFESSLSAHRAVLGERNPGTLVVRLNFGRLLGDLEDFERGEEELRLATEGLDSVLGAQHMVTVLARSNWGNLLRKSERFQEARQQLTEAAELADSALSEKDQRRWEIWHNLGLCLLSQFEYEGSERALRKALRGYQRAELSEDNVQAVEAALQELESKR